MKLRYYNGILSIVQCLDISLFIIALTVNAVGRSLQAYQKQYDLWITLLNRSFHSKLRF